MDVGSDLEAVAAGLQERMMELVRAFGLHQPDRTPCGRPVSVSEAHALASINVDTSILQGELVRRLRLEKSTVSRLVRQLEARGWLTRSGDDADGRAVRLSLTEAGKRAAGDLADARATRFAQLAAAIPEDHRSAVLSSLSVLVEAMK